jgi:hypothetical protein
MLKDGVRSLLIAAASETGSPLPAWVRKGIKCKPMMLIPAVLPGGSWKSGRYTLRVGDGQNGANEVIINGGGQSWSIVGTGEKGNGLVQLVARLEGCSLAEATIAVLERSLRHLADWAIAKQAQRQRAARRAAA